MNKKYPLKSYDPSLLVTLRIEFSLEIKGIRVLQLAKIPTLFS